MTLAGTVSCPSGFLSFLWMGKTMSRSITAIVISYRTTFANGMGTAGTGLTGEDPAVGLLVVFVSSFLLG